MKEVKFSHNFEERILFFEEDEFYLFYFKENTSKDIYILSGYFIKSDEFKILYEISSWSLHGFKIHSNIVDKFEIMNTSLKHLSIFSLSKDEINRFIMEFI